MKELNKKEAIGDLLDAFTEVLDPAGWMKASGRFSSYLHICVLLQEQISKPAAEASSTQANPVLDAQEEPPSEAADETWEEKEDKHSSDSEGPKPAPEPAGQKHQSKEGSGTLPSPAVSHLPCVTLNA